MLLLRSSLALVLLLAAGAFAWAQAPLGPQAAPNNGGPQNPQGQAQPGGPPNGAPLGARPMAAAGTPRPFAPAAPRQPDWIPLPADHEAYLNKVLEFWEHRSSQIERFRCAFTRWDYDPAFGPRDPKSGVLLPRVEAAGEIMYAAPDKGSIRIDTVKDFRPTPVAPGSPPPDPPGKFGPRVDEKGKNVPGEHWVSDGKSIYEFLHERKELHRIDLPPNMQGQAITEGPLPFIFGAKADKLKQRYWFRVVTPSTVKDQYWLEAWPKFQQDASNYRYVQLIIDQKEYLPLAVELNDQVQGARRAYLLDKREVNWNEVLSKIFSSDPFNPKTPSGYKLIVENVDPTPGMPPAVAQPKPLDAGISPAADRRFQAPTFPRK